ncbi:hypothetical protein ASPFODRAFT_599792 [Aspergillus luchuensis CBS 106.47]|uniref:Uncharacterized protein n=1 Tax=Aspergillus luchuensis (strain CBS 106.47) TaxID=1137211 RepID=A0A1M3TI32_ASPLC|nr:hypothetical protein ASPFODRAFT_599792 [Aspergillus luchuensis CBS 106.47]
MRLARAESGGRAGKWRLVLPFWEGLPAAYSWSPYYWTISAWKDLPGVELIIGDSGRGSVETLHIELLISNDCYQIAICRSS